MKRPLFWLAGSLICSVLVLAAPDTGTAKHATTSARVYVFPIRDPIADPVFYMLRRGLKEAIEQGADTVVLDLKTPGGQLDTTLEIMEALQHFDGRKIAYVDTEAMSAGAFIASAADEIWFAPEGVMGAAAPVTATGQDVDQTMKQKLTSYLKARVRAFSEGKGYRGQVLSAMIDENYELKIGDIVVKPKGELLSLTAAEAAKTYGDPPQPLLSSGTAKSLDELLTTKFGAHGYMLTRFESTWSESLASWLNAISPVLLGLGLLGIYLEFKVGGHGGFAAIGAVLLALVFLGHYIAGLSGQEPALAFVIGFLLVTAEVIFFPGVALPAVLGLALMLGSLVWAMADLWPNEPISFNGDVFTGPLINLGSGLLITLVLAVLLARYLPKSVLWKRMIVQSQVNSSAQVTGGAPDLAGTSDAADALIGRRGVAVTALFPSGQVSIDGRRYPVKLELGFAEKGAAVVVTGHDDFGLLVKKVDA